MTVRAVDVFSLSPQRGEGRGEGWELQNAFAFSKGLPHSPHHERHHTRPGPASEYASSATAALAVAARQALRGIQI